MDKWINETVSDVLFGHTDDSRVMMKDCVQRNPVYGVKNSEAGKILEIILLPTSSFVDSHGQIYLGTHFTILETSKIRTRSLSQTYIHTVDSRYLVVEGTV